MTAIVGIATDEGVHMGSDSISVSGWTVEELSTPKLWERGEYLIGTCGSLRFANILRYCDDLPDPIHHDLDRWMAVRFVDHIRELVREAGHIKVENSREEIADDSGALIAVRGRLYELYTGFTVERRLNYGAVGSGHGVALGALYATRTEPDPKTRILQVLEAAAFHDMGVREPFDYRFQAVTS